MLKSNKGVTLVALVITIIVLLILAGVSISLVVGDNGVLSNATGAVDDTNLATAQEDLEMALSSVQADFYSEYVDDTSMKFINYCDSDAISAYLDASGRGVELDSSVEISWSSDDDTYTSSVAVTYKGTTYTGTLKTNASNSGAYIVDGELTESTT